MLLSDGITAAFAQASIDSSLPEEPLAHKRELFLFAGYRTVTDPGTPVPSLRTKQKFELAYRETTDLTFLIRTGLVSGFDYGLGVGPDYGRGMSGFGKLYAYNAASIASTSFFSDAVLPAIFHQDPRYFRKGSGSVKSRLLWALKSQVVAYSDRGTEMLNYGNLIGPALSTALSNAYMPEKNISFGNTIKGYAIKEGITAGLDVSREFGGLNRLIKYLKRW